MNIGLFEDSGCLRLLPLTWLRACFELRCGRDRLVDKVRTHLRAHVVRVWVRDAVEETVAERFTFDAVDRDMGWCLLNARALVTTPVLLPPPGVAWQRDGELVAAGVSPADLGSLTSDLFLDPGAVGDWLKRFRLQDAPESIRLIKYPWDLVAENEAELRRQCQDGGVQEGRVYPGAHLVQSEQIHIACGARVKPGVVLDAEEGPIHVAEDVLIQPNAVLEGPCYVGPGSVVRPGAALRAGTSLGPVCKVGGELVSTIIHGHTSKQHDGFLGHSYVGEWVNLGADTVTSDLKNTYGTIRVSINGVGVESGQQFVGCFIGDHVKTAIGTVLPTGCVIGVASNVFTAAGVPRFVPSFAWLTDAGLTNYRVEKAVQTARIVMGRRDVELSSAQQRLLEWTAEAARTTEAAGWA